MPTQAAATGEQSGPKSAATLGIGLYLALAAANAVLKLVEYSIADEESSLYVEHDDDVLYHALDSSFGLVDAGSGLLLALGIGVFYALVVRDDGAPVQAAVAAAVGTGVALALLVAGLVGLAPDGSDIEIGKEVTGLVASILGAGAAGALGAIAIDKATDFA